MILKELLKYIDYEEFSGDAGIAVAGLCADSQKVRKNDLFFCYKGKNNDSHDYAEQAVENGASVLVCERKLDLPVAQVIVKNGREAVAKTARAF